MGLQVFLTKKSSAKAPVRMGKQKPQPFTKEFSMKNVLFVIEIIAFAISIYKKATNSNHA